jgi:hypothetical protein
MVNYENTKIYKIESHLGPKIYIGSTTKQYLSQRMDSHRRNYKCWKYGKGSHVRSYDLFDEYGIENCKITLIEVYPCNIHDEKALREGYYIRTMTCVNKLVAGRTKKEYDLDNIDKIKEYRKDHIEEKKELNKKWKDTNQEKLKEQVSCECGGHFTYSNKSTHLKSKKHLEFINKNI